MSGDGRIEEGASERGLWCVGAGASTSDLVPRLDVGACLDRLLHRVQVTIFRRVSQLRVLVHILIRASVVAVGGVGRWGPSVGLVGLVGLVRSVGVVGMRSR